MFVLKRVAASIHKARRREMRDSEVAAIAEEALKDADWKVLRGELLRDGLIVEFGSVISFAHHSFQEFLTARHLLGDLNTLPLNEHCEEYLKGSDWWQEVLCFYIDLAAKPQEIRVWLDERLRVVCKYAERRTTAEENVRFLRQYIDSSFPYAR
jgi:predicted NACHT family NTPase